MQGTTSILMPLQEFASAITAKMNQPTSGEPEDQLRGPFENLISAIANAMGSRIVCTGETPLPDRLGRPDYAIHLNKLLAGYVELKAPGIGANAQYFRGHNRNQFKRFSAIPNILYTDGNQWALYRSGELVGRIVIIDGDVSTDGQRAITDTNAKDLSALLQDFFSWNPIPPLSKGKIDLKRFAAMLAPLTRMLRDDVTDALKDPKSPLVQLANDWRQLLFPDATDDKFADAYAQTVAFALLLGRSEGADPLSLETAEKSLSAGHSLLARALRVLTDPDARSEMTASLDVLIRIIGVIPPKTFTGPNDPWLYFYEDFLAAYDPKLRKDAGAYYTPVEVVRCQVRLIDDLLVNRLNKPLGFADSGVVTLDPAVGTGTYLLGVIHHALERIEHEQGAGAVAGKATELANNLYGFEIMVGPYAVTELRLSRSLRDRGASLPKDGTHVYLTDTLESPNASTPTLPLYLRPISDQHAKALKVKSDVPVIVCLGNPPYDRHEAVDPKDEESLSRYGGWVRFGDPLVDAMVTNRRGKQIMLKTARARIRRRQELSILQDFIGPAIEAGHGVHVKNLYNLYVYFWRWGLWRVFEQGMGTGPGIASFITASSYIDGDAFCGMREHLRRQCDEIWILDLGGEGRGTRKDDNVFAIQTPVVIAIAFRGSSVRTDKPARTNYARIEGSHHEKLLALDSIESLEAVHWQECSSEWQAPLRPEGQGLYFSWPLITDIFPWQHSGVECKRTWPIAPDADSLRRRWKGLLTADNRAVAFRETGDRNVRGTYGVELTDEASSTPIEQLSTSAPVPPIQRYGFRSFDRQMILADARLMSRPRPDLWKAYGCDQIYLTCLFNHPLGSGPALTVSSMIPDRHHFRGSYGGKDVIPLYRTSDRSDANITPDFIETLTSALRVPVSVEDLFAYVYGLLAQPSYTERFNKELETREVRVPITRNVDLFRRISDLGANLIWIHTFGERLTPKNGKQGSVPRGAAKCIKAVPDSADQYPSEFKFSASTKTLHVGAGEFAPVSSDVFNFSVSGLRIVQSWLGYRMREGKGKTSSPLDDIRPERWTSQFTTELLELLWVLEATVDQYPKQANLFEAVIASECFTADELPAVPDSMRKPPKSYTDGGEQLSFFENDD